MAKKKQNKPAKESPGKADAGIPSTAATPVAPEGYYGSHEEVCRDRAAHWQELSRQRAEAQTVLEKHRERLLALSDVSGLHVGFKETEGKIVRPLRYVLCIHVKVKRAQNDPLLTDALDGELDGVPTDVIEMSYRQSSGGPTGNESAPEHLRFRDVLEGGVAISRESSPSAWGTLGLVVHHFGQPMFLTNQHIAGSQGDQIRQPPFAGSTPLGLQQIIGETALAKLSLAVDCAIIRPNGTRPSRQTVLGVNALPDSFMDGELDEQDEFQSNVFKVGAKTGFVPLRVGLVHNINADLHIPGHGTFAGQILVANDTPGFDLIEPGDSGSVLLKKEERATGVVYRVVGLVHAETEGTEFLVASHFRDVKRALGIRLHPEF